MGWLRHLLRRSGGDGASPSTCAGVGSPLPNDDLLGRGYRTDLFVSYKTHDATFARPLVEALMASGVATWFAEYSIPLSGAKSFHELISAGIRRTGFGVCFLSERYLKSEHCREEARLLTRTLGPDRIIKVLLPGIPLKSDGCVAGPHRIQHRTTAETITAIARLASLKVVPMTIQPSLPMKRRALLIGDGPYVIDVAGWKERPGPTEGAWTLTPVDGRTPLVVTLRSTRFDPDSKKIEDGTLDDDEYFQSASRQHILRSSMPNGMNCVGTHLVRIQGFRHLAFTAISEATVARFYVIHIPGRSGGGLRSVEAIARFEGSLTRFFGVASRVDRLLETLTHQPPAGASAIASERTSCAVPGVLVSERAEAQARALRATIDTLATEYLAHHVGNVTGAPGRDGVLDLPLKVDILFKSYPPELSASLLLRMPVAIQNAVTENLLRLSDEWDRGSRHVAARVMACYLGIIEGYAREHLLASMTDGTRVVVERAASEILAHDEPDAPHRGNSGELSGGTVPTMVLVAEGEFLMGTSAEENTILSRMFPDFDPNLFHREGPQRRIWLDRFFIDRYPVTNRQYKAFTDATGYPVPWRAPPLARPYNWDRETRSFPAGRGDHPVVLIDWNDARAYAKWCGKRLPTEAEWEKAARGLDGYLWPWGNEWDAHCCNNGVFESCGTSSVMAYPNGVSPFGVSDMAGNVWEWCADGGDADYHLNTPRRNPLGQGERRVIRGGCFFDEYPFLYRCAVRDLAPADAWEMYRGFRCASDLLVGADEAPTQKRRQKMSSNLSCPKCGRVNELVDVDELRFPFQKLPKEAQQEIARLTDQRKGAGVMMCAGCGCAAVRPMVKA